MRANRPVGLAPFAALWMAAALCLPLGSGSSQSDSQEETGQPETDATRLADYMIEVALDPELKELTGRETIIWTNAGGQPTDLVKLHLYMNAFRSPDTRFFAMRPERWSAADAGWIDVLSIRLATGEDLGGAASVDETVLTVRLPKAVEPGQRLELVIEFKVRMPRLIARSGYSGDYFFVAQWFPKIGVFLDGRWICDQYSSFSEFFSDFGRYRVAITVPRDFNVGATGVRVTAETRERVKTLVYVAHPVHDFAWVASPNLRLVRRELDYPQGPAEGKLDLHILLPRDRMDQAAVYEEAVRRALNIYTRDFGPYPYPKLTVVDPAPGRGLRSGGMEYPTLITGGGAWLETYLFPGDRWLETVTVHELGHQWWYGVVASDEVNEPWLDEGLTMLSEHRVMSTYGPYGSDTMFFKALADSWTRLHPFKQGFDFGFAELRPLLKLGIASHPYALRRDAYLTAPSEDRITTESWRVSSGDSYWINTYNKPVLALSCLQSIVGEQTLTELLRRFFQRFRFRHPTDADFRALASEVAEQDLEWFFSQVWDGSAVLDYEVESVSAAQGEGGKYVSIIELQRRGEVILPQTVRLTFSDGAGLDIDWVRRSGSDPALWDEAFRLGDGAAGAQGVTYRLREGREGRWLRVEVVAEEPVIRAQIDPDYGYPLDVNLANNSYSAEACAGLASRGSLSWMRLVARLLHGLSVYN